jgi:hypothetical protein
MYSTYIVILAPLFVLMYGGNRVWRGGAKQQRVSRFPPQSVGDLLPSPFKIQGAAGMAWVLMLFQLGRLLGRVKTARVLRSRRGVNGATCRWQADHFGVGGF